MNYIKHLSGFFEKVSKDDRLNPTHISLYISLFQFWNTYRFHNPISISRNDAMKVSKICSKVTYHKCIRELNDFGYLRYEPSYNPFKGSLVYLFDFQTKSVPVKNIIGFKNETGSELVANRNHTQIETSDEQALIPYINNSNNSKQKTIVNAISKNKPDEKINYQKSSVTYHSAHADKKEKLRQKKESSGAQDTYFPGKEISIFKNDEDTVFEESGKYIEGFQKPVLKETKNYFARNSWPDKEAEKFYNHYESNGWMIGKTPMVNWYAAADNWMLKSENFNTGKIPNAGKLQTTQNKDYSEPL